MRTLKRSTDQNKLLTTIVRRLFQDGKKPIEVVDILNEQQILTPYGKEWKIGNFVRWTNKAELNQEKIYKRILANKRLIANGYSPEVDRILLTYYGKEKVLDTHKRLCDAGLRTKSGKLFSEADPANVTFIATRYLGMPSMVQQASVRELFERLRYVQKKQFKKTVRTKTKVPTQFKLKPQPTEHQPPVAEGVGPKMTAKNPIKGLSAPKDPETDILLKQVSEIVNSDMSAETKLFLTQTLLPKN